MSDDPSDPKRFVEYTTAFKRDFRRESRGRFRSTVQAELEAVIRRLADDLPLPPRCYDHALTGNWKGHRDCHLRPDLVLIYRKLDGPPECLQLVRLGSHSELSL